MALDRWRRRGTRRSRGPAGPARKDRLDALEARIDRLEAELEGLQDALYRQAVMEREHFAELCRRTAPGQIARDLSEDARKRGL